MLAPRRLLFAIAVALGGMALVLSSSPFGQSVPNAPAGIPRTPTSDGPRGPMNVVFIVVDTLRADRLTATRENIPLMPKLKTFAAESWWFTRAISQSSWTRPSMASIFTSLYMSAHGTEFGVSMKFTQNQSMEIDVLPSSTETMAAFLKKAGFKTVALQTNPQLQSEFGFAQGFDSYQYFGPETKADKVTDCAIEAIDDIDTPFFLYAHYMDPHGPYMPPPPYNTMFGDLPSITDGDKAVLAQAPQYYFNRRLVDMNINPKMLFGQLSLAGRELMKYLYDGEVRFVEDEVARLVDFVRRQYPNSIVVFTSDHGEEFWEHGSIGHSLTVYQEAIHVPLIVNMPGRSPRRFEDLVETIDILPTLAALLGLSALPDWQGRDLRRSNGGQVRAAFSRTKGPFKEANIDLQAVVHGHCKLIWNGKANTFQLFDLANDPQETTDLTATAPEALEGLQSLLEVHHEKNARHPQAARGKKAISISAEIAEELRAIGYLSPRDE